MAQHPIVLAGARAWVVEPPTGTWLFIERGYYWKSGGGLLLARPPSFGDRLLILLPKDWNLALRSLVNNAVVFLESKGKWKAVSPIRYFSESLPPDWKEPRESPMTLLWPYEIGPEDPLPGRVILLGSWEIRQSLPNKVAAVFLVASSPESPEVTLVEVFPGRSPEQRGLTRMGDPANLRR